MINSSSRSVYNIIIEHLSDECRMSQVPEVSLETCQKSLNTDLDSTQVCAGGELGKDACSGDSGGGLFIRDTSDTWHLLGIVSYGAKECGNGIPGVYTRVSSFLQWISNTRAAME